MTNTEFALGVAVGVIALVLPMVFGLAANSWGIVTLYLLTWVGLFFLLRQVLLWLVDRLLSK